MFIGLSNTSQGGFIAECFLEIAGGLYSTILCFSNQLFQADRKLFLSRLRQIKFWF